MIVFKKQKKLHLNNNMEYGKNRPTAKFDAKVLVVEDNSLNMELEMEIIESMGFSAHGAADGKPEAL